MQKERRTKAKHKNNSDDQSELGYDQKEGHYVESEENRKSISWSPRT